MIEVRGLDVRYPQAHALRGVDLSITPGSFVLIGGASGGGKSTLAHALMGLDPRRHSMAQLATRVGLVFQNPATQLFNETVEEEVSFGPRNLGTERAAHMEAVLAQTDLLALRHRPTQALSAGEQQRTVLAATLSLHPALVILDEPTVGQDWQHLRRVMDFRYTGNVIRNPPKMTWRWFSVPSVLQPPWWFRGISSC